MVDGTLCSQNALRANLAPRSACGDSISWVAVLRGCDKKKYILIGGPRKVIPLAWWLHVRYVCDPHGMPMKECLL